MGDDKFRTGDVTELITARRRALRDALLSAFPSVGLLRDMVYFDLGVTLDEVAETSNLRVAVLGLVQWAESSGNNARLLAAASAANPGNPRIGELVRRESPGASPARQRRPYTTQLAIPYDLIERALGAIRTLSKPSTWDDLVITHDISTEFWMGSDSDVLIDILYSLMMPAAFYSLQSYTINKNFAFFDWRSRLQALTLQAANESFRNDYLIAALRPGIPYSPRVPDWRRKRQENPQRYWWQGLSQHRFDAAMLEFQFSGDQDEGPRLLTLEEFREHYHRRFNGGPQLQQALGLAANALYGFSPERRPVYWRMLIIQARLYGAILRSRSENHQEPTSPEQLLQFFELSNEGLFHDSRAPDQLNAFEDFGTTLDVGLRYVQRLIEDLFLMLQAPQERL